MSQRLLGTSRAPLVFLLSALCLVLCCVLVLSPRAAVASPAVGPFLAGAQCQDAWEPNDSFAKAPQLETNTGYSAAICTYDDVDYYLFWVDAGYRLSAGLYNMPYLTNFDLEVYDESQKLIDGSYNDDPEKEDWVEYDIWGGGWFYMYIFPGGHGNYSDDPYSFRMNVYPLATATPTEAPTPTETSPPPCPDEYEPNNSFYDAFALDINIQYSAYICYDGDLDYFGFDGVGDGCTIETYIASPPVDVDLYLMDGAGTVLGSSTNEGTLDEYITYQVSKGGYFVIEVEPKKGEWDPYHAYKLFFGVSCPPPATDTPTPTTIVSSPTPTKTATPIQPSPTPTTLQCNTDPSEPNDTFATAHVISVGGWTQGLICPQGDTDFWKFAANAGQMIRLELRSLPANYELFLWSPGEVMVADSANPGTNDELIVYQALETGDYRAEVRSKSGEWHGSDPYDLRPDVFTATPTPTNSPTATPTRTSTPTRTRTPPATPTRTATPAPDVITYGLEITQGMQNIVSDMPLVAGRVTRVRGYVLAAGRDVPNVRARLYASRGGLNLPHSPVESMWRVTAHVTGANRLDLYDAFFFYIWPEWQSGTVTFRMEVNYDHSVPESDYSNNTWQWTRTFYPASSLNLYVRPLDMSPSPNFFYNTPNFWYITSSTIRFHPITSIRVAHDDSPMGSLIYCPMWAGSSAGRGCMITRVGYWDDHTPDPMPNTHWVGLVHEQVPSFGVTGQGNCPGDCLWVKMEPGTVGGYPWLIKGASSYAHELGHNFGMRHVYCSGTEPSGGDVDWSYPYSIPGATGAPYCRLAAKDPQGYYGLDVYGAQWGLPFPSMTVISNDEAAPPPHKAFALMGYLYPSWVSPWEYCTLLRSYGIPCNLWFSAMSEEEKLREAVAADPVAYADPEELQALYSASEYLLATGTITVTDRSAQLGVVVRETNPLAKSLQAQAERIGYRHGLAASQGVTFTLVQVDSGGQILAANDITLNTYNGDFAVQPFYERVPLAAGTARVQVRQGDTVLAERAASAHPPTVALLAPNGGGTVGVGTVVQWTASDLDGDMLAFDISYSRDNGATWQLLNQVTGSSYTIASPLPGSSQGRMRVTAMDGFHSAQDASDGTFTVLGNAPSVEIFMPVTGNVFPPGSVAEFRGFASDLEDGSLEGSQLTWTSSIAGTLGSGEVLATDTLQNGLHHITLTARDSNGQTGTATVDITVGAAESRIYLPVVMKKK